MNWKLTAIIILSGFIISCKNNKKPEINPYGELINNPMSAMKVLDTVNIAKLTFREPKFDFGYVNHGDSVVHDFKYYNTGKKTLLITDVNTSCGCTSSRVMKDKLEPGDSSILRVVFNSKDREGFQEKSVIVFANTFPPQTQVTISGTVLK
jgi:hypothetical protein